LLELTFVLVVLAVLSTMILPVGLNMLKAADISRANRDIQDIAIALTAFYADTGRMPICDTAECQPLIRVGAGQNNRLSFLAVGEGRGSLVERYPPELGSLPVKWDLAARGHPTRPAVNNAANHLVVNDPTLDGLTTRADYSSTGRSRWRGPYLGRPGLDPWGNAYIVSVGAMDQAGEPIVPEAQAWVISAGPNGVLETPPDALALEGDDIGQLFVSTFVERPY
jgi:type II secretory pathway pseudopilin PulG